MTAREAIAELLRRGQVPTVDDDGRIIIGGTPAPELAAAIVDNRAGIIAYINHPHRRAPDGWYHYGDYWCHFGAGLRCTNDPCLNPRHRGAPE